MVSGNLIEDEHGEGVRKEILIIND